MMRSFISKNWVWICVVSGPAVLLLVPILGGNVLYWGTPSLQFIPWQSSVIDSLRYGNLPVWNPLNGMGAPLAANYQLGCFYPLNWILYIIGAIGGTSWIAWGYSLLIIIHLVWAGAGMILLMRQLEVGNLGQAVAGISMGLCGFLIGRLGFFSMIWAAVWIPWVLLYAGKIAKPIITNQRQNGSWINHGLVICLAMQLLAGHAQLTWYTWMLVAAWVMVGGAIQKRWHKLLLATGKLALAIIIALVISAIQLLPTAEYLSQSQRAGSVAYEGAMTYSFWPWRLVTLAAPDLFGSPGLGTYWGYATYWEDDLYFGFIPLCLAVSTLLIVFRRQTVHSIKHKYRSLIIFAWIAIVLVTVFAMGKFTPVFPFLYDHIPTFAMFNSPTRWMLLVQIMLIVLAGIGTEYWHFPTGKTRRKWRLILASTMAIALGAFAAWLSIRGIALSFIQAMAIIGGSAVTGCLFVLWMPREESIHRYAIWRTILLFWICADLVIMSLFVVPMTNMSRFSPEEKNTALVKILKENQRVYLSREDEYLIKFSRFLRFKDYRRIEDDTALRKVMLPNLNLLEGISSVNNFDPLLPERYTIWMEYVGKLPDDEIGEWLRLMNVGVWERRDISSASGIRYEKVDARGRYQWYESVVAVQDGQSAWIWLREKISKLGTNEQLRSVVVENWQGNQLLETDNEVLMPVVIEIMNKAGYTELDVVAKRGGILVMADTWYPGWKVYVDDQEQELLRANYLFLGVELSPGKHNVIFCYSIDIYIIGGGISILGCVFLTTSYIIQKRKKKELDNPEG
jgi:hypothetical protein